MQAFWTRAGILLLAAGTTLAAAVSTTSAASNRELRSLQNRLGLPAAVARVTDGSAAKRGGLPEYLLIQDLHRQPEAQRQIAAILIHAAQAYQVQTVFIEGAMEGETALLPARINPSSVADALNSGKITGPQLAALRHERAMRLKGLENADLYRQNVQAYQRVRQAQEPALGQLSTLRLLQRGFDLRQARLTPGELDRLERLVRLRIKPPELDTYRQESGSSWSSPDLAEAVEAAEDFYRCADQRSSHFLDVAEHSGEPGTRILVIGGFHTARMAARLRSEGKSFAIISPRVTAPGDERLYADRMNETISALRLNE